MTWAYWFLTFLSAMGALGGAWMNFTKHRIPVEAAKQVSVPQTWARYLGAVLLAGGLGLLAGLAVPMLGIAASAGLTVYFVCAVGAHLRVGDRHLAPALMGLALAGATFAVTLAHHLR